MSDLPPSPDAASSAFQLPSRTTPTWEVEILLSGATVFALFQAYGGLSEIGADALALLPTNSRALFAPLLVYLQAGLLALALGFLLHLLLRAMWVARVGLRSVDPTGSVRESITLGPTQRRFIAEAWAALPQRIHALDDWASLTFALALGLAQLMAGLIVLVLGIVGLSLLLHWASGGRWATYPIAAALSAIVLVPMVVATWLDGRAGKRKKTPAPWIDALLRVYRRGGMLADNNLAMQVLTHRMSYGNSETRGVAVVTGVMLALLFAVGATSLWQQGIVGRLVADPLLRTEPGQRAALRGAHYRDTRLPGQSRAPYIDRAVVDGPFLRLHVPIVDDWHHPRLRDCVARQPDGAEEAPDAWRFDARAEAVLACMAEAQPIRVDGRPMASPWLIGEDDLGGHPSFVVMVDVRGLAPGPHVLEIAQPEAARTEADDDSDAAWRIPFWR